MYKNMKFLQVTVIALAVAILGPVVIPGGLVAPKIAQAAQTLYNGIVVPDVWPPNTGAYVDTATTPWYVTTPPNSINISTGRQLFVDNFLVESSPGITKSYNQPTPYGTGPVVTATTPTEQGSTPTAMTYSGGVFFDTADNLYKMWYMCGYVSHPNGSTLGNPMCYATSPDGKAWTKPQFTTSKTFNAGDVNTNIVFRSQTYGFGSFVVWIDSNSTTQRYKATLVDLNNKFRYIYSSNGTNWTDSGAFSGSLTGDRSTSFYDPFQNKWALSLREAGEGVGRARNYFKASDSTLQSAVSAVNNSNSIKWLKSDSADTRYVCTVGSCSVDASNTFIPQLYNFDTAPYESVMLGQFSVLQAKEHELNNQIWREKIKQIYFGYSRDGFTYQRPDTDANGKHIPMVKVSDTSSAWNNANIDTVAGGPIIVPNTTYGEDLYIYYSGRTSDTTSTATYTGPNANKGSVGLATLRRDGFVSLNAGSTEGTVTTKPVVFNGKYMFVNADATGGSVCAEIWNADTNQIIAPFTKANCSAVTINNTKTQITWANSNSDLTSLIGTRVKFKFFVTNAKLYSFWVSPSTGGESMGYIGGGGPGYAGYQDTGSGGGSVQNPAIATFTANSAASVTVNPGSTVNFAWTGVANATAVSLTAGGSAVSGCSPTNAASGSCSITATNGGSSAVTTTYTLTATGSAGTTPATRTVSVTVNPSSPSNPAISTFTVNSAASATVTSGTAVNFAWTGIANATSVTLTTNGQSVNGCTPTTAASGSCSSTVTNSTGSPVTSTYTLTANGVSGTTPATRTVTVTVNPSGADTTAPTMSLTSPVTSWGATYNTSTNTVTVTGTATDNVGVTRVWWQSDRGFNGDATGTTSWTFNTSLLSGTNNITIFARDAAGNSIVGGIIVNYTPPPAPVISSFTSSASTITSGQSLTFNWTWTNGTPTSASINQGVGTVVTTTPGSKTITAPTVSTSTQYTYTLTLANAGGTVTSSVTVTVNPSGADTTAPTMSLTSPVTSWGATYNTSNSTVTVTGTASDNVGVTRVWWTSNKGYSGDATGTTSWTFNTPVDVSSNSITIFARDAAGNSIVGGITIVR